MIYLLVVLLVVAYLLGPQLDWKPAKDFLQWLKDTAIKAWNSFK